MIAFSEFAINQNNGSIKLFDLRPALSRHSIDHFHRKHTAYFRVYDSNGRRSIANGLDLTDAENGKLIASLNGMIVAIVPEHDKVAVAGGKQLDIYRLPDMRFVTTCGTSAHRFTHLYPRWNADDSI